MPRTESDIDAKYLDSGVSFARAIIHLLEARSLSVRFRNIHTSTCKYLKGWARSEDSNLITFTFACAT